MDEKGTYEKFMLAVIGKKDFMKVLELEEMFALIKKCKGLPDFLLAAKKNKISDFRLGWLLGSALSNGLLDNMNKCARDSACGKELGIIK